MVTKLQVSLNNVLLHGLDNSIVIQGIDEQVVNTNPTAVSRAGLNGQRFQTMEKRYRDVVVSFAIREKRFGVRRQIYDKVCKWARDGGELRVGYRNSDTVLYVVCTALPALGNVSRWADPMTMTFRAYDIPCWIELIGIGHAPADASTDVSLNLPNEGSMPTKLEVICANQSGSTCNTVTITSGGQKIRLTSLGLANGETLFINYDSRDIQRIYIRNGSTNRSVLAKRTVDSNDDIWIPPRTTPVLVQSDVVLSLNFFARGRYD